MAHLGSTPFGHRGPQLREDLKDEGVFNQVCNESFADPSRITSAELQAVLSALGLSMRIETIRLMMGLFASPRQTTIGKYEFRDLYYYLLDMVRGFTQLDVLHEGRLGISAVADALHANGYEISKACLNDLYQHFDFEGVHQLDFDGYFELCVFVGRAANGFKSFDVWNTGRINIDFNAFLSTALSMNFRPRERSSTGGPLPLPSPPRHHLSPPAPPPPPPVNPEQIAELSSQLQETRAKRDAAETRIRELEGRLESLEASHRAAPQKPGPLVGSGSTMATGPPQEKSKPAPPSRLRKALQIAGIALLMLLSAAVAYDVYTLQGYLQAAYDTLVSYLPQWSTEDL